MVINNTINNKIIKSLSTIISYPRRSSDHPIHNGLYYLLRVFQQDFPKDDPVQLLRNQYLQIVHAGVHNPRRAHQRSVCKSRMQKRMV